MSCCVVVRVCCVGGGLITETLCSRGSSGISFHYS